MFGEWVDGEWKLYPSSAWPAKRQEYIANAPNVDLHLPIVLPSPAPRNWFERCTAAAHKKSLAWDLKHPRVKRAESTPDASGATSVPSPQSSLRSPSVMPPPSTSTLTPLSSTRASTVDHTSSNASQRDSSLMIRLPRPSAEPSQSTSNAKGKKRMDPNAPQPSRSMPPPAFSSSSATFVSAASAPPAPPPSTHSRMVPSTSSSNAEMNLGRHNGFRKPEVRPSSAQARFSVPSVPRAAAGGQRNVLSNSRQSSEEVDQLLPDSREPTLVPNDPEPMEVDDSPMREFAPERRDLSRTSLVQPLTRVVPEPVRAMSTGLPFEDHNSLFSGSLHTSARASPVTTGTDEPHAPDHDMSTTFGENDHDSLFSNSGHPSMRVSPVFDRPGVPREPAQTTETFFAQWINTSPTVDSRPGPSNQRLSSVQRPLSTQQRSEVTEQPPPPGLRRPSSSQQPLPPFPQIPPSGQQLPPPTQRPASRQQLPPLTRPHPSPVQGPPSSVSSSTSPTSPPYPFSRAPAIFSMQGVQLEPTPSRRSEIGPNDSVSVRGNISEAPNTPPLTPASATPSVVSVRTSEVGQTSRPPVVEFLESLSEPLPHLRQVLERFGFTTHHRLNVLSNTPAVWPEVAREVQTVGTLSDWTLIQEGLEARAAKLGKLAKSDSLV